MVFSAVLYLNISCYYKTVVMLNWLLDVLYTVPWFMFFTFTSTCLFSHKQQLGLDYSSDCVIKVVSSHISLPSTPPPFLSALKPAFCTRVTSLCQKWFVTLVERRVFCIKNWRIPLLVAVKRAIHWVHSEVTVPLVEWWCFLNARKDFKNL